MMKHFRLLLALLWVMSYPLIAQVHDHSTHAPAQEVAPKTKLTIEPVVVQNMAIRVAPVSVGSISRSIRTLGEVFVAEDRISVVNLRFSGWVKKLLVSETGQYVKKGQVLLKVYSPELIAAQEEYLLAISRKGVNPEFVASARDRLAFFGISKADIQLVASQRRVVSDMSILAPQAGYVLKKDVVLGARVQSGKDLYQIGNLNKIWVNAQVYDFDAPWLQEGARATMELSFERGKSYAGKVSYIYPTLNPKTRTLTVRLEFDNPTLRLKPGMFATLQIETQKKDNVLVIPTEAIIHSGDRQIVFVVDGYGTYKANEIVTGLIGDGHVTEVISGLLPSDEIVVSGQFLLDSESQLQEAVQKLLKTRLQENRGEVGAKKVEQDFTTFWTCSMHPQVVQDESGRCPICGMDLVEKQTTK